MKIILGERVYERTKTGKYPKYNEYQMNIYVDKKCMHYTAMQVYSNILCYDHFGKYQNELTPTEKKKFEKIEKQNYGLKNVDIDDLVDWEAFDYDEQSEQFKRMVYSIKKSIKK